MMQTVDVQPSPEVLVPASLILKSCDEARQLLRSFPALGLEDVPVAQASGRVMGTVFLAPHDLPEFPRATMDGYAVRGADVQDASETNSRALRVMGTVPMGGGYHGPVLDAGQAVGISTGGMMPAGADAVVMVEYTQPDGPDGIRVSRATAAGVNVIQRGEDIRQGELLLAAGQRLRPDHVGLLAGFGVERVPVYRQPRVAVLSTGNELVPTGVTPQPGQVRDVNTHVLAGQAEAAGAIATRAGIARDDEEELRRRVTELLADHDALFLSGGSSVGVRDLTQVVVGSLGGPGILFHGVAVRPGKPTLVARIGDKPVIGMPGNPVSSHVIFDVFMRELLWQLGGETEREPWPSRRRARLTRAWTPPAGKEDYVRVRLHSRSDGEWAEPLLGGSSAWSTVVRAHGLLRLPVGCPPLAVGAEVEVYLY
jgi:molybdopterin molybdotransferase